MSARKKIIGIVVIALVLIVGVVLLGFLSVSFNQPLVQDFEKGVNDVDFGDWAPAADVSSDPNNPGDRVQWRIQRSSNFSRSGTRSAEFFIDGTQDDGTIWLERRLSVKPNAQFPVSVSFWLYSESESFNTLAAVVAYAGTAKPVEEADFTVIGSANEQAGWKRYVHNATINTDGSGQAYVAVGISVRWETLLAYCIDDIVIEHPRL